MDKFLLAITALFLISCSGNDDKKSTGNITQGEKDAINKISDSAEILDNSTRAAAYSWDESYLSEKAKYVYNKIKETCEISFDQKKPKENVTVDNIQFTGENCVLPYKAVSKYEGNQEKYSYSSENSLTVIEKQIQDYTGVTEANTNEVEETVQVDNNDPKFNKRYISDNYAVTSFRTLKGEEGLLEYDIQSQLIFSKESNEAQLVQLKSRIILDYPPHYFLIRINLDSSGLACTLNSRPVQCTDFINVRALSQMSTSNFLDKNYRLKQVFHIL